MVVKKAYAKINMFLNVLSQRADGMHEVDMIMTPLTLHDTLYFEMISDSKDIILDVPDGLGTIQDNLIYRAAVSLQKHFNIEFGAKIKLEKRIPIAAGLAGGSSDAAATLQGLCELWEIEATNAVLEQLAVQLGADVVYCLYHKTMRVRGIGEKLELLTPLVKAKVILFKPTYGISTKEAYANLHKFSLVQNDIEKMIDAINKRDYYHICMRAFNSFETATYEQYPDLGKHRENITTYADTALLSGSGPTIFAIYHNENQKKRLLEYGKQSGLSTFETETKI